MDKRIKHFIRQIHLWLGLGAGLIVFIVSITGCLYVFEEEIRDATQNNRLYVPVQQRPFTGLKKIIEVFEKTVPGEKIQIIQLTESQPNATVELSTKKKSYFFSPYTAGLVYEGRQDWLHTVEEIHTTLLLGESGKFIQRWAVVIFVIMLITGWVLWFPKQVRHLKQALKIKWGGSFKRVNHDLHSVLGFYASWILIVISCSGLYFAFKEVKTAASFFTGSPLKDGKEVAAVKEPLIKPISERYDHIYRTAALKYPGAEFSSMSIRKTGELRLRMTYPYRWSRKQNTFFYDATTGQLLRAKLYKEFNGADLIEATNYDLHTGRLFGLFGKIVACIAALISASLPVTGFVIWLNRKKKKKAKKKRSPPHSLA
jgi:uncharacterized iron-regulated membrane protein